MPIEYVLGDATRPVGTGPRVIVHVCNDVGGWGKGFVVALSKRWKSPEESFRRWHKEGGAAPFELGQVQFVEVEPDLWVANLIGQHDIVRKGGVPPVRYGAIRSGLERVAIFAKEREATIHMPRIGAGLAGGDWTVISSIVDDELVKAGLTVKVYDYLMRSQPT